MSETSEFFQFAFKMIGTNCQIIVYKCDHPDVAINLANLEISKFDDIASYYRSDSELSTVNVSSSYTVPVSDRLFELFRLHQWAFRSSNGVIDATYGRNFVHLVANENPRLANVVQASPEADGLNFQNVALDSRRKSVTRMPGVIFDFGGLGKAFLSDHVACVIQEQLGCGVLVNLGGDIAVAGSIPPGGWQINVTDDFSLAPDSPGARLAIFGGGVASSALKTRVYFDEYGKCHDHIVVSNDSSLTTRCIAATAVGSTSLLANFYTLSSLASGSRAVPIMASYGVPALIRTDDNRALRLGGWPRDDRPSSTYRDHLVRAQ